MRYLLGQFTCAITLVCAIGSISIISCSNSQNKNGQSTLQTNTADKELLDLAINFILQKGWPKLNDYENPVVFQNTTPSDDVAIVFHEKTPHPGGTIIILVNKKTKLAKYLPP